MVAQPHKRKAACKQTRATPKLKRLIAFNIPVKTYPWRKKWSELHALGFQTIGLDSDGADELENSFEGKKLALVLGAEGKGLRQKTRETVMTLARIEMPGAIKSLNVSNAAALSLYAAHRFLSR